MKYLVFQEVNSSGSITKSMLKIEDISFGDNEAEIGGVNDYWYIPMQEIDYEHLMRNLLRANTVEINLLGYRWNNDDEEELHDSELSQKRACEYNNKRNLSILYSA